MAFTKDFLFGTATAAYQIEGRVNQGGRSPSIWDTFCETPGKIIDGCKGDTACDSYMLYEEDISLMKELEVNSYRFSISWSRIFNEEGHYNPEGMDYYRRLLSSLKENNIKAAVTLYHWDLPQWAQDQGGWVNRKSVDWYMDLATKCFEELDGLVDYWVTLNEPLCAAFLGYLVGVHAPGHRSVSEGITSAHHLLLGHGRAIKLFREKGYQGQIGVTLNLAPQIPKTDTFLDRLAASNADGYGNRWFLDPVFKGSYPNDMCNLFSLYAPDLNFIKDGDLNEICQEIDFLGINYYNNNCVQYCPAAAFHYEAAYTDIPKTSMGWDITPEALGDIVRRIRREYTDKPIMITENGSAWDDVQEPDGRIHDSERAQYLEQHLKVVEELNDQGMNVTGYFVWTLMDNFEWAFGYSRRFGLAYTDYATQRRIPKDSFYRYRQIIRNKTV